MFKINDTNMNELEFSHFIKGIVPSVFDQMPMPINFVDKGSRVITMNKAFLEFLKLGLEDVVGKKVAEIDSTVRLPVVLKTGQAEINQKHRFKSGQECIVHRVPFFHNDQLIGGIGIISCNNINSLNNIFLGSNLSKNLILCKSSDADKEYKIKYTFKHILTHSLKMLSCKNKAVNYSLNDLTVLITGESGVGKELFAHSIHNNSNRKNNPFVTVNCGAIPETLMESELFGYEDGAFTGARKSGKKGKFELANGGTIFLDEIGELPLNMQAKLLRVLQENELERIGGTRKVNLDVRIIAATNTDLIDKVEKGNFREDLFYRINVLNLRVPSLRERKEDIPMLIDNFSTKLYQKLGICKSITGEITEKLSNYYWPGNVRQLKNVVESMIVSSNDSFVKISDIPDYVLKDMENQHKDYYLKLNYSNNSTLKERLKYIEEQIILDTLRECNYNKAETCRILGIPRMRLYRKLK